MLRLPFAWSRALRGRWVTGLVLAATSLLPAVLAACEPEAPTSTRRLRPTDDTDATEDERRGGGDGAGDYDPASPINQGPAHNASGFAAVRPILESHCSECHHAGTWLDLTGGADAATATKIIDTIERGSMPPAPRSPVSADDIAKIRAWQRGDSPEPAKAAVGPSNTAVTPILSSTTLATYKAALPKVAWPRLAKILESPSTLFWDKAALPPAYQDTVGDGGSIPFGARFNDAGRSLIVPEGKKLFSDDGKTWAFPFGHTAGADESTNAFIVNFMSLPPGSESGEGLLPVAYRIETDRVQGLPIKRWNWSFPRGTVVGEIVMIRDGASLVTSEIRVRERSSDRWATNVFRPFPTAQTLATAIKERRPSWQGVPALAKLVAALEDTSSLSPKTLASPAFSNLVTLSGFVDAPLPDVEDDELVRDLLRTTTFVATYGTSWKASGEKRAFGPTGPASRLHVVPNRFDTGLLEVRESTCSKCHDQGGWFIGDLVDEAILYGDVWGTDRIFSFHPWEPSRIDASGNENRVVRAAFASIVVPYDAAKHPSTTYTFYRPR